MPPGRGWPGASGNENTCNAQGFIIQFKKSAMVLYMVALQVQYLLTIKYGWNEKRMKTVEPIFHGVSISFGLSTAIAALILELYNPADWNCWISPLPRNCTSSHDINMGKSNLQETDCIRGDNAFIFQWAFFYGILWPAILFCILVMLVMIRSIRAVEEKSMARTVNYMSTESAKQTRKQQKPTLVLTEQVTKQSMMYAMGFFIVWTFPTTIRFIQTVGGTAYPILVVLAGTFVGSQGFWNALIYFRPKYIKLEEKHWWEKVCALIRSTLFFWFPVNDNNDLANIKRENSGARGNTGAISPITFMTNKNNGVVNSTTNEKECASLETVLHDEEKREYDQNHILQMNVASKCSSTATNENEDINLKIVPHDGPVYHL